MFKIVVPVFNAEKFIDKCCMSIANQTYQNFQFIIIDDASLDTTAEKIINGLRSLPEQAKSRFKFIKRHVNVGALENIVYGISVLNCLDDDVIVLIDGDDWLYSTEVLKHINDIYTRQSDLLLTYGNYLNASNNKVGLNKIIPCSIKEYRDFPLLWCTSHLRTFKYGLWKNVKDEDLRDKDNKYFKTSWDRAMLYPMIEMAGEKRIKFIEEITYVYNDLNDFNDYKVRLNMQLIHAVEIAKKKSYKILKTEI